MIRQLVEKNDTKLTNLYVIFFSKNYTVYNNYNYTYIKICVI